MAETWDEMVARRSAEPGAAQAYEAARLAYELGEQVRKQREKRGWSQQDLAAAAGMRQPAVARFEAGGTVPKVDTLQRLLAALDGKITISFPRSAAKAPKGAGTRGTPRVPEKTPTGSARATSRRPSRASA